MKSLLTISIVISIAFSQQGLNINDLEASPSGKQMYPYSGKIFDYWGNGNSKLRGRFRDGLRNGKWTFWHPNGQKKAEGKFFDGDGSEL
ncbi:MAG TPA: hypothetical protein EYO45_01295, partial [Candidatus Marinimicrobia bacterium]|nr:hypothetical protein [Candidatus Neomarinimicrobiota bacterium]